MSTDGRSVWIGTPRAHRVTGIDARTGRVLARIDVGAEPLAVSVDRTGLWILTRRPPGGRQYLLRYDRRNQRTHTVPLATLHSGFVVGAGSLRLADAERLGIVERDPRTLRRRSFTSLGRTVNPVNYAGGYVWLVSRDDDTVTRLDPRDPALSRTEFTVGEHPTHALVADDTLFVGSEHDHTVRVLDPETTRPVGDAIQVPLNPFALATDGESVWVASLVEHSLTRLTTG